VSAGAKLELLGLIDRAVADGWAHARCCRVLDLADVRAHRWRQRLRETGTLEDRDPGGGAVHGLLAWEEREILDLIEEWGWVDLSHRKLCHRGSYTGRVFVSASTLLRVALKNRVVLPGEPFRPRLVLPAMPQVPWEKNRIWIWDATSFTRCKRVAYAIVDVVTRYWIGYLLTSEQTSTQAQLIFAQALADQDLLDSDGLPPTAQDGLPILIAWSDNGPEMTATDTRQFMALMTITQHHGRPGTRPTRRTSRASSATSRATATPGRHHRPGRSRCRARARAQAVQHRAPARRHRVRHPRRRAPRPRPDDPPCPRCRPPQGPHGADQAQSSEQAMTDLLSTTRSARAGLLRRDGACLREGVARWQGCQRNWARMTPHTTTTNQAHHKALRWVEKVGRSITNSETPHCDGEHSIVPGSLAGQTIACSRGLKLAARCGAPAWRVKRGRTPTLGSSRVQASDWTRRMAIPPERAGRRGGRAVWCGVRARLRGWRLRRCRRNGHRVFRSASGRRLSGQSSARGAPFGHHRSLVAA